MHTSHAAWARPGGSAAELVGAHREAGLVTGRSLHPSTDGLLCPDIQGQGCHPPAPSAVISQMCVHSGSREPGRRLWQLRRTSSPRAIVLAAQDASCPWSPPRTLQADSQVPWNLSQKPSPGSWGTPCFSCVLLCRGARWTRLRTQRQEEEETDVSTGSDSAQR